MALLAVGAERQTGGSLLIVEFERHRHFKGSLGRLLLVQA